MSDIIPYTVSFSALFAIGLFIVNQAVELLKNRRSEARRLKAYKLLICEELKENFFAFEGIISVISSLLKSEHHSPNRLEVSTDRYGNDYVRIHLGENGRSGINERLLKRINTQRFESHCFDISLLDHNDYLELQSLYKQLLRLSKIRNDIVCSLASEIDDLRNLFLKANLDDVLNQNEKFSQSIRGMHKRLSGYDIKIEYGEVREVEPSKGESNIDGK